MTFSLNKKTTLLPKKEQYLKTFLLALLTAAVLFVPFMIINEGYFLFYGDFNVQQIPFYKLAHDAILNGETAWNFSTDLGVNFIGSYTFYLLGSPFFLLSLIFPSSVVPYLMGPLLILKFALAALTAYCFIRRFTRTPEAATIGALLYAFSGFSVYNIFFNHFHEAIIVFPLLLLSLELLITENKRGFFAIMVAVSALVNYFFFFGMVVFTVIYWIVRVLSGNLKVTFKGFLVIAFEAVLGLAISAILLLPSFLALMNNSRLSELQLGWNAITYGREQIYLNIFQSLFFPPDIPARPVFFPGADVKWSSVAAWLPVFSVVPVFAIMQQKKKSFLRRILGISFFMALVPVLNSAFYMFNTAYYARWYYMPILMMCLATATTIEDNEIEWNTPFKWVMGITLAITAVIGLFPQKNNDGELVLGLYTQDDTNIYKIRFVITAAIAVLGLLALKVILPYLKTNYKRFCTTAIAMIMAFSMVYGVVFIATGKTHSYEEKSVLIDQLLESNLELENSDNYRVDVYEGVDNTAMFLGLDSINAFHSIVPTSVTEFWEYVGEERGVASRPTADSYATRSLLSVKYLLDREGKNADDNFEDQTGLTKMSGFTYYKTEGGYKIYENQNYIPYGFTYDYYVTRKQADSFVEKDRSNLMVKAILLEDSQILKYGEILTNLSLKDTVYDPNYIVEEPEPMLEDEKPSENSDQTDSLDEDTIETNAEVDENGESNLDENEETSSTVDVIEQSKQDLLNQEYLDVDVSAMALTADAAKRAKTAGSFEKTKNGFKAEITLEKDNLVFYSIPYDEGWTAYVNGEKVDIEKVNVGFMAVLAKSGTNTIEFKYETPGLNIGILITLSSILVLIIYLVVSYFYIKKKNPEVSYPEGDMLLEKWVKDEEKEANTIEQILEQDYWEKLQEKKEEIEETNVENEFGDGFLIDLSFLDNDKNKEE